MDRHKRRRARKNMLAFAEKYLDSNEWKVDLDDVWAYLAGGTSYLAWRYHGEIVISQIGNSSVECVDVTAQVRDYVLRRRQEIYDTHTAALVDAWREMRP